MPSPRIRKRLNIDVVGRAPGLARWLESVAPARARGAMSVAIVSDARVRALNRQYRKKDTATDVLSFPSEEHGFLGDVVIASGVAARQAREAGHPLATELRVLALHGLLHLFIPVRLLLGGCLVAAGVLIARVSDIKDAKSVAIFVTSLALFVVVCEHLVPAIISRHDPEDVLDLLLPAFTPLARLMRPMTVALMDIIDVRREREADDETAAPEAAADAPDAAEQQEEGV